MSAASKIPPLRFKGFEGAWEAKRLSAYLKVSGEQNEDNSFGVNDVLSVSGESGVVNQIEFQGRSFAGASVSGYHVLHKGQVTYTKSPLKANPYGIIKSNKGKDGIVSSLYGVYDCVAGTCADFVQCYFDKSSRLNNYLRPLVCKGAKNTLLISDEEALQGTVVFPANAEQEQIAQCCRSLDALIADRELAMEKLQSLKKAMLEKMFPRAGAKVPEVRFKGCEGEWERKPLDEIAKKRNESALSGGVPKLEYEDIVSFEGVLKRSLDHLYIEKRGISFYVGDVLFGKLRPYLGNWFHATFDGVAVGDWWVLKPVSVVSEYLYVLIQSDAFQVAANQSAGSKMPRADWNLVSETLYPISPTVEEQRKIGAYFRSLDALISARQEEVGKLKNLKKALLDRMFV